jgi:hypothetical protein
METLLFCSLVVDQYTVMFQVQNHTFTKNIVNELLPNYGVPKLEKCAPELSNENFTVRSIRCE